MMMMKRRGVFVRGDGICTARGETDQSFLICGWMYHVAKGWMDDEEENLTVRDFGKAGQTDKQKAGR